jgi:hypothetical protein
MVLNVTYFLWDIFVLLYFSKETGPEVNVIESKYGTKPK